MQLVFDRLSSLGYMTNLVGRLMVREIDVLLSPHGLSVGYMPVFFALAADEALTQRDLAISAQVEQPTMAATLARMERDGLIERRANPDDGRSALISLSKAGRDKLPAVHAASVGVNDMAAAQLSDHERRQLLALLTKVAGTLGTIS
jgi:MarR family transcriptional regulator for hemolysin